MQVIKENILFNSFISGGTMNLRIPIRSNDDFLGYQQEIDNLTSFVSLELVNPVNDLEKRRYRSLNSFLLAPQLSFKFYNGTTYYSSFVAAGFTSDELLNNDPSFLNSFFIFDFYDTYDINSQSKIFSTYLTKKGVGTTTTTIITVFGIQIPITVPYPPAPEYAITADNQLYYWYVPNSYMETQTGTTTIGYVKLSFYNAKTGKLVLFINEDNESSGTPERMYFKAELNKNTKTWKFLTTTPPYIKAKEFVSSAAYITRANTTVDRLANIEQNPPSGNTFTYNNSTGYYVTT